MIRDRMRLVSGMARACQSGRRPHSGFCSVLWEPSQSGGFAVCLHWHHQTVFFSATSSFTGCRPVPLWEPSQNGWCADRPQEHHQWTPASTSSATGFVSRTTGFSDMRATCTLARISARQKPAARQIPESPRPARERRASASRPTGICRVSGIAERKPGERMSLRAIQEGRPTIH